MKKFCVLLLFITVATGCVHASKDIKKQQEILQENAKSTGPSTILNDGKIYKDEKYDFHVTLPKNWDVFQDSVSYSYYLVTFWNPEMYGLGYSGEWEIDVSDSSKLNDIYKSNPYKYKSSEEKITIDGSPAMLMKIHSEGTKISESAFLNKKNRFYLFRNKSLENELTSDDKINSHDAFIVFLNSFHTN